MTIVNQQIVGTTSENYAENHLNTRCEEKLLADMFSSDTSQIIKCVKSLKNSCIGNDKLKKQLLHEFVLSSESISNDDLTAKVDMEGCERESNTVVDRLFDFLKPSITSTLDEDITIVDEQCLATLTEIQITSLHIINSIVKVMDVDTMECAHFMVKTNAVNILLNMLMNFSSGGANSMAPRLSCALLSTLSNILDKSSPGNSSSLSTNKSSCSPPYPVSPRAIFYDYDKLVDNGTLDVLTEHRIRLADRGVISTLIAHLSNNSCPPNQVCVANVFNSVCQTPDHQDLLIECGLLETLLHILCENGSTTTCYAPHLNIEVIYSSMRCLATVCDKNVTVWTKAIKQSFDEEDREEEDENCSAESCIVSSTNFRMSLSSISKLCEYLQSGYFTSHGSTSLTSSACATMYITSIQLNVASVLSNIAFLLPPCTFSSSPTFERRRGSEESGVGVSDTGCQITEECQFKFTLLPNVVTLTVNTLMRLLTDNTNMTPHNNSNSSWDGNDRSIMHILHTLEMRCRVAEILTRILSCSEFLQSVVGGVNRILPSSIDMTTLAMFPICSLRKYFCNHVMDVSFLMNDMDPFSTVLSIITSSSDITNLSSSQFSSSTASSIGRPVAKKARRKMKFSGKSSTTNSANNNITINNSTIFAHPGIKRILDVATKVRTTGFSILAVLTSTDETIRKKVIDSYGKRILPIVINTLKLVSQEDNPINNTEDALPFNTLSLLIHKPIPFLKLLESCIQLTHSFSRSPQLLRTLFQDFGGDVWPSLVQVVAHGHYTLSTINENIMKSSSKKTLDSSSSKASLLLTLSATNLSLCCLCNLLIEFSPCKTEIMDFRLTTTMGDGHSSVSVTTLLLHLIRKAYFVIEVEGGKSASVDSRSADTWGEAGGSLVTCDGGKPNWHDMNKMCCILHAYQKLRLNSVWALMNAAFESDVSMKNEILFKLFEKSGGEGDSNNDNQCVNGKINDDDGMHHGHLHKSLINKLLSDPDLEVIGKSLALLRNLVQQNESMDNHPLRSEILNSLTRVLREMRPSHQFDYANGVSVASGSQRGEKSSTISHSSDPLTSASIKRPPSPSSTGSTLTRSVGEGGDDKANMGVSSSSPESMNSHSSSASSTSHPSSLLSLRAQYDNCVCLIAEETVSIITKLATCNLPLVGRTHKSGVRSIKDEIVSNDTLIFQLMKHLTLASIGVFADRVRLAVVDCLYSLLSPGEEEGSAETGSTPDNKVVIDMDNQQLRTGNDEQNSVNSTSYSDDSNGGGVNAIDSGLTWRKQRLKELGLLPVLALVLAAMCTITNSELLSVASMSRGGGCGTSGEDRRHDTDVERMVSSTSSSSSLSTRTNVVSVCVDEDCKSIGEGGGGSASNQTTVSGSSFTLPHNSSHNLDNALTTELKNRIETTLQLLN